MSPFQLLEVCLKQFPSYTTCNDDGPVSPVAEPEAHDASFQDMNEEKVVLVLDAPSQ
jgi:hypothetical protein